jgi:hypothetical protein
MRKLDDAVETCFMGDSEGAGDKGESYDLRLYVAVLVVCRLCILNLPGHVGKQAFLSRVAALATAAKSLELGEGGKRRRGAGPADQPFGHLHVVCRNYQLTGGATGEYEVSFKKSDGYIGIRMFRPARRKATPPLRSFRKFLRLECAIMVWACRSAWNRRHFFIH